MQERVLRNWLCSEHSHSIWTSLISLSICSAFLEEESRLLYIIIRCKVFALSINAKTFCFSSKKLLKNLDGKKKVRTFAPAFAQITGSEQIEKEFFERVT